MFYKIVIGLCFGVIHSEAIAQDIEELERLTDDTIRSACHGYLVDMLPESWRNDAYAATERCDPNVSELDDYETKNNTASGAEITPLGTRIDRNIDINIECGNEYMCMEQRIKWRDAGQPIAIEQYQQVAQYCEERYTCIEAFFAKWPQPLPTGNSSPEPTSLSFTDLMGEDQPSAPPSFGSPSTTTSGESAFDSLIATRQQKALVSEGNSGYREILEKINSKSLLTQLDKKCGDFRAGYYTPASPRTIRNDMQDMQEDFENYSECYSRTVPNWDANGYQLALNNFNNDSQQLAENFGIDISQQRQPLTIDQQFSQMQQQLNDAADRLKDLLEEGPRWIESLYASGTFKRPNSGPSAMQIFSQVLAQTNQNLARQNQANQQAMDNLIKNINVPKINAPTVAAPAVTVTSPTIDIPKNNLGSKTTKPSLGFTNMDKTNTVSNQPSTEAFACLAPSETVCIHYSMPKGYIGSFRDRCSAQKNQLLTSCPANMAVSCRYSGFGGSITINNYGEQTNLTRKANDCREMNGQFTQY